MSTLPDSQAALDLPGSIPGASTTKEEPKMGYHYKCDWCGACLNGEDYAKLPVAVKRRRRTRNEAHWAEEVRPTLFFCVPPEPDREGLNRMGLPDDETPSDSCFERAMLAIQGTDTETPDMGLEWRLVPIGARVSEGRRASREPVQLSDGVLGFLNTLAPSPRSTLNRALRKANLTTLDEIEEMGVDELMGIKGIGQTTVTKLRRYIAAAKVGA
jgi:hypothetical protein